MKIGYDGKVKSLTMPKDTSTFDMPQFKRLVSRKFVKKATEEQQPGLTSFLDQTENLGVSIMEGASPSKKVPLFSWDEVTCFYEDSEGDLNVISEDEDLLDAMAYLDYQQKKSDKPHSEVTIDLSIL